MDGVSGRKGVQTLSRHRYPAKMAEHR
jgi:hypothetical protein